MAAAEIAITCPIVPLKRDNYQGYITLEGSVEAKDKIEGVKESIKYFRQMEAEL